MSYLSEVLADAPIYYWRLADPPGTVANTIGSAGPQPLFGSAIAYGSLGYSGGVSDGGCLLTQAAVSQFYGSVQKLQALYPVTVEWLLWHPGVRDDGVQDFPWGWGDSSTGPFQNQLGDGRYAFNFGAVSSVPVANVTANAWHHFAFQYSIGLTTFSYFVDGVLQPQPAFTAVAPWLGQLMLGRRNSGGAQYIGAISEFAIYNATLSTARLGAHRSAIDRPVSPPVFKSAGNWDPATGTSSGLGADTAAILAAVRQTYSNSP